MAEPDELVNEPLKLIMGRERRVRESVRDRERGWERPRETERESETERQRE